MAESIAEARLTEVAWCNRPATAEVLAFTGTDGPSEISSSPGSDGR